MVRKRKAVANLFGLRKAGLDDGVTGAVKSQRRPSANQQRTKQLAGCCGYGSAIIFFRPPMNLFLLR